MSLISERPCEEYPLHMIQSATKDFDESNLIGKGGFGEVYKGMLCSGWVMTTVAVKRLKRGSRQGVQQFHAEIKMLSMCRHSCIVTLMGYCNESDEMILVYEYMSGGNLANQLFGFCTDNLSWGQRLKICIQAARALQHLHTGHSDTVIHLDVKCANILLDEHMNAKISDLGLSTIIHANQCEARTTFVQGTRGYIDPHYRKFKKCSSKTDVYAFGVVLLELLTGTHVTSGTIIPDPDLTDLAKWIQQHISHRTLKSIIDRNIVNEIHPDCRDSFAEVISKYLRNDPRKRPLMSDVVAQLELALEIQNGTEPSSSVIDSALDKHFNGFDDDTYSDDLHEHNIFGKGTNPTTLETRDSFNNEHYNIFSKGTNPATSETRESFDESQRTSRWRTPTTESWMKFVQPSRSTFTMPSQTFISCPQDLLPFPKTVIGLFQKKVKRRSGRQ